MYVLWVSACTHLTTYATWLEMSARRNDLNGVVSGSDWMLDSTASLKASESAVPTSSATVGMGTAKSGS